MKILCIHGIGKQEDSSPTWHPQWANDIKSGLSAFDATANPEIEFLDYDELFVQPLSKLGYRDFAKALVNLIGNRFDTPRGLFSFSETTKWYAGMVVTWINDPNLRKRLRDVLADKITTSNPDIILGHSLGSLIAYDTFSNDSELLNSKTLITLGSQIGNPFVAGSAFGGRLNPFPNAKHWYHLYNPNDRVFTASLNVGVFETTPNFTQVVTKFGEDVGWSNFISAYTSDIAANHSAHSDDSNKCYLRHPQTQQNVWMPIASARSFSSALATRSFVSSIKSRKTPDRRALLIGINDYPEEAQRLEGCRNDVFLMSSILQESGFEADEIRVVFDDRATAEAIRDRMKWLLSGVNSGDTRFLFYSGHGAQLPTYGSNGEITHVQSCLVPYDFNWTPEKAITDQDLVQQYSQLPYDSRFMMMFDCCNSGGLTKGGSRIRGIDPPDDIRHRMLRWNKKEKMWERRPLEILNKSLSGPDSVLYQGIYGDNALLGRAMSMRTISNQIYDKVRKELNHSGPYAPIVYEACGENEYSYEYAHGATSYGAFTFAMAQVLRSSPKSLTFEALLEETIKKLHNLKYNQTPEIFGPKEILKKPVPWAG